MECESHSSIKNHVVCVLLAVCVGNLRGAIFVMRVHSHLITIRRGVSYGETAD